MLKFKHGFKNWDLHSTVPSFEFHFNFQIPKPRKERIILEKDAHGRIVTSRPVQIATC